MKDIAKDVKKGGNVQDAIDRVEDADSDNDQGGTTPPPAPTAGFDVAINANVLSLVKATASTTFLTISGTSYTFKHGSVTVTKDSTADNFTSITVGAGETLSVSATDVDGKTIDGAGSVIITKFEDKTGAVLTNVTAADITVQVSGDTAINNDALKNKADKIVVVNSTLSLGSSTEVDDAVIEIAATATLALDKALALDNTVIGSGTIAVADTSGNDAINLSALDLANFAGSVYVEAGLGADAIALSDGADVVVVNGSIDHEPATASTVEIDVTDAQANALSTFSIKLAGVSGGNAITIADLSGVTDGTTLAAAVQVALRAADGGETDISVAWNGDVLTITDAKGRDFSEASLKDDEMEPAEVDDDITITNGNVEGVNPVEVDSSIVISNGSVEIVAEDADSIYADALDAHDTITDFSIANDKLSMGAVSLGDLTIEVDPMDPEQDVIITNGVLTVADTDELKVAVAELADLMLVAGQAVAIVVTDDSDTYVFISDGTAGVADSDIFVQLEGVIVTDLADILA